MALWPPSLPVHSQFLGLAPQLLPAQPSHNEPFVVIHTPPTVPHSAPPLCLPGTPPPREFLLSFPSLSVCDPGETLSSFCGMSCYHSAQLGSSTCYAVGSYLFSSGTKAQEVFAGLLGTCVKPSRLRSFCNFRFLAVK